MNELTINQIIADCERYWLDTKVPRSRVKEMATELESHLLEAAAEDKSPEAVVGPDLAEFAEAWASEYRGPTSLDAWNNTGDRKEWRQDLRVCVRLAGASDCCRGSSDHLWTKGEQRGRY